MYVHVQVAGCPQFSLAATSSDCVHFELLDKLSWQGRCPVASIPFYFRRFSYEGHYYALVKAGPSSGAMLLRARWSGEALYNDKGNPLYDEGPLVLERSRHTSVLILGPYEIVALSRIGDAPERIELECHYLEDHNWTMWFSNVTLEYRMDILVPSTESEGAQPTVRPSTSGAAGGLANELRDPYLSSHAQEQEILLFYSIGGEHGISVALLVEFPPSVVSQALLLCRSSCSLSDQSGIFPPWL